MSRRFDCQIGYVTFAQNNEETDYLRLAYLQALSIKLSQNLLSRCAVIVDKDTYKQVLPKYRDVFDYIIVLEDDDAANDKWKLANEWKAFQLTPFRHTIKLDADLLYVHQIEHWWLYSDDFVFSKQVVNYKNEKMPADIITRKVFIDNDLPYIYTALWAWKYTENTEQLFQYARIVYKYWPMFRDKFLLNYRDDQPTTDVVFSLALKLYGNEKWHSASNTLKFTHLKPSTQGWTQDTVPVTDRLLIEFDNNLRSVRVGGYAQYSPIHYHNKNFITDEIIEHYEQVYRQRVEFSKRNISIYRTDLNYPLQSIL